MERVEINAASRQADPGEAPASARVFNWQPSDGGTGPLGMTYIMALAEDEELSTPGSTAGAVLDGLTGMLLHPTDADVVDLDSLAQYLFDSMLTIDQTLRDTARTCHIALLAFRDDGFVLGRAGNVSAYHLRAARMNDLAGGPSPRLGECESSDLRMGVGGTAPGDRLVIGGTTLAVAVAADPQSFIRTASLAEPSTACLEVSAWVAAKGLVAPMVSAGQVKAPYQELAMGNDLPPNTTSTGFGRETGQPVEALGRGSAGAAQRAVVPPASFLDRLDTMDTRQWLYVLVGAVLLSTLVGVWAGRRATPRETTQAPPVTSGNAADVVVQSGIATGAFVTPPPATAASPSASIIAPSGPGAASATATAVPPPGAIAEPGAGAPAALAEGAPTALTVRSQGRTISLAAPLEATWKVTALGTYTTAKAGDRYRFRLNSPAAGQRWRIEAAEQTGTTAENAAASGTFTEGGAVNADLPPGTYRLVVGSNVNVATIEVGAAESTEASPAGAGDIGGVSAPAASDVGGVSAPAASPLPAP